MSYTGLSNSLETLRAPSDPVVFADAGGWPCVVVCVGVGVGVTVGTDGGVCSPIHPADIKTATIVTMAIKPVMDFFFVVFIVLASVSYPVP